MARYTVTRRNENSSYLEPVSITLALSYEELQTFTDALRPTGYSVASWANISECIIQQLLDLINPPSEVEMRIREESAAAELREVKSSVE